MFVPNICVDVNKIGILHAPEMQAPTQTLDVNWPVAMNRVFVFRSVRRSLDVVATK